MMGRDKAVYLALVTLVALVVICLYGQIDYTRDPYAKWDLASYRRMAAAAPGLATNVVQPFTYRLLGPYVVGLLTADDPPGFYAATVLAALALIVVFYLFLCRVGLPPAAAASAAILFAFNRYLFGLAVWDFFQINDVLSLLFVLLLFWAMLDERWGVFAAVLLAGAATRETVMLMIPTVFVYLLEKKRLRANLGRALAAILPGLALFVVIRMLAPVAGGRGLLEALAAYGGKATSPEAWLRLLIIPFIPLTFVPLVFVEQARSFMRQRPYAVAYVLLVLASTLFGQNNERLMAPAFVIVYWLMGAVLQDVRRSDHRLFAALAGILVLLSFLASLHHEVGRFVLPDRQITVVLGMGALAAATVAALAARLAVARRTGGAA